ncbi:MAG: outer membrane protein assembly factor BamE [Burkholderiales bacterium]
MKKLFSLVPLLLAGCFLVPHKIDMQQGNYLDAEVVAKLKPGMTRSQVRFLLGTPLVVDVFHPQRWDYVYLTGKSGDVRLRDRLAVIFEGDKLERVQYGGSESKALSQAATQTPNP